MDVYISSNKLALRVKDLLVESCKLDKLFPSYEASLMICSEGESFTVSVPCQVIPGPLQRVTAKPTNFMKQLLPGNVIKELVLEMFDAYGNHLKEDAEILLNVVGICFQDKTGCIRKVDNSGRVDLSGLLKVTNGYGKTVSLSVLSNKKVVFKEEFQIEEREMRVASKIPECCAAGSLLENVVFEIINSEGDVDETIHDEETCGLSHTLKLNSESIDIDNSVRYSFCHGRCTVRAIPLPQQEGRFSFVASHSRIPELHMIIEVLVKQPPKVVYESIQSQCSDGKILLLKDSSTLKTPKVEHDDIHDQYPDGTIMLLRDSSASKDVGNLLGSIMNDQKELEEDVFKYGLSIGQHEEKLQQLHVQQLAIEEDMSKLQASVDLTFSNCLGYLPEKEVMIKRIQCKGDSAAAVVCKLFKEQNNDFSKDILGVVALLGTVQINELSRILAEYLGEEQMLAVVCESYTAACDLEKYDKNGNVNRSCGLQALATAHGRSLSGRYNVICLEDIRPYNGELDSDPQRKLLLPNPRGERPPGYVGYAVNMIYLDVRDLHKRTAAGHGLRETLFYRLFGELQVYETREDMKMAHDYIHQGAVSLDGGIMRGNGVISLGCWEPNIHFPVVTPKSQLHMSPHSTHMLMQIEEKKSKLREKIGEIDKVTNSYNKKVKRFNKKRDRYRKFLEEKGPLQQNLEYRFNMNGSYNALC